MLARNSQLEQACSVYFIALMPRILPVGSFDNGVYIAPNPKSIPGFENIMVDKSGNWSDAQSKDTKGETFVDLYAYISSIGTSEARQNLALLVQELEQKTKPKTQAKNESTTGTNDDSVHSSGSGGNNCDDKQSVKLPNGKAGLPDPPEMVVSSWPKLNKAALYGIAGEFVEEATKHSEADPAGVLFTFISAMGTVIGCQTYVEVGDTKHPARINSLVVGATAKGRKGTSAAPTKKVLDRLSEQLGIRCTPGPLSSGEGLIFAVRDASDLVDKNGNLIDLGVDDKRLLVLDEEFARAIASFQRTGNTLATTIRAAFDSGNLDPLTKHCRIKATGAHICVVSHITIDELLQRLDAVEIFAGTINRFLLCLVRRSKLVSRPVPLNEAWLSRFIATLSERLLMAQNLGAIKFDDAANAFWDTMYPELSKDETGLLGAIMSRSETLAIRLALLYALLDEWNERPVITVAHLKAAFAVIDYSIDSARYLYGNAKASADNDRLCQRILKAISAAPEGRLSLTDISRVLGRNVDATKLHEALVRLQATGRLTQQIIGGGRGKGRPKTWWSHTEGFKTAANEIDEVDEGDDWDGE